MERALLMVSRAAIASPRASLAAVLALALAGAVGMTRLELRTDGHDLVPPEDPTAIFDSAVRREFGLRDSIVLFVETAHPDGIYNPETLRSVRELSDRLATLDGIGREHVSSLATEASPRVHPGTLAFRSFLDPFPDTPEEMARLRRDVETVGILTGTLVSADASATAILVGSPRPESIDPAGVDRAALFGELLAASRPFESESDHISVVGAPVAEALLGTHILEDLALLVPLAMLVISLVVWVGCRSRWGVALVLGEVGACLLFTFGLMGWSGVPVYLTTAILPVVLTTIGIADEIHILWRYQRLLAEEPDDPAPGALTRTMAELVRPLSLTSATTAVAFLSFLTAPIAPVQSFGVYAALGIGFCWLWSLVAMPAALALLGPGPLRRSYRERESLPRGVDRVLSQLIARPTRTLQALVLATALIGAGALGLRVQDSWIDGFAPQSPLRRATERVDAKLHGTHVLLAHLAVGTPAARSKRQGPLLDPAALRAIRDFEAHLRDEAGAGGVLGPHSHLTAIERLLRGPGADLPEDPRAVARLVDHFERARGERRRREVIHDDQRRALVTILLKGANYRDTALLMEKIRAYEAEHLAPLEIRVDFAGDVAVSQAMIPAIVRTQLGSIGVALLGIFVLASVLARSLRIGAWTVLPTGVAVLWLLGAMGWLRIPMGVATSTFCAIALGIGVDYAVHLLDRIRRAEAIGRPERIPGAVREAAPAIVADALAVALGFGVLTLSRVPANARLGLLVAVALLAAAALTLVGLPALVAGRPAAAPHIRLTRGARRW